MTIRSIMNKLFLCFLCLALFFIACNQEIKNRIEADFNELKKNLNRKTIQYESDEAGGGAEVENEILVKHNLEYNITDEQIFLQLNDTTAEFRIVPVAAGLPTNWQPYTYLEATFTNRSTTEVEVLTVLWCPRGRLPDTLHLQPGETYEHRINLLDLPLIGSVEQKYQVNQVAFNLISKEVPAKIELKSMALLETSEEKLLVVVDEFGQRVNTDWPTKVESEAELKEDWRLEKDTLSNYFEEQYFDDFFGYKGMDQYESTGFFYLHHHIENYDTTWFFVTPAGHPFWSVGVTGIRPKKPKHAVTLISGNEQLFQELPERNGPYGSAYIDSTFSFYNWNILRKYDDLQNWRDLTYRRLQNWGVNTIGNWAEKEVITGSPVPFTYSFESEFRSYKKDVFNPEWIAYVDSVISEAAEFKDNPYLLGYFVDNESGWGNLDLLNTLPKNAFLRQQWLNYLQSKYNDLSTANQQWNGKFNDWQAAMNSQDETLFNFLDVQELEKMYARQYFEVITSALKKYDPNHLYLGCRFTRKLKPLHLLAIAGEYCDVVTVNVYSYEPDEGQMGAWHRATGRPLLIGEHHVALKGKRQLPLRWQVFDEKERYEYLTNYISTWARQPYSLGSHWYQYSDQHLTGRASNGENQLVGLVDITDQPHKELIKALREVSQKVYDLHF